MEKTVRSKVKLMCSFGGKILPRPFDGVLKYVGGETRVIAVSHDISFSDLMNKLTEIAENDMVLKYQIIPEELDALVSVKSDEDLKHMMDEYNRHETPKLRTYLFPSNLAVLESQIGITTEQPQTMEQRYIEAINGIVRTPKSIFPRAPPIKTRPSFTVSASSSPRSELSPDGYSPEPPESGFRNNNSYQLSRLYPMHKVHSSPNISYHMQQPQSNSYFQPPRLPPPLDFPRGTRWEQPVHTHYSGGSNSKWGCNENRRFYGRASSVPQSPRKHGLRL